jgi:hypothetical protein
MIMHRIFNAAFIYATIDLEPSRKHEKIVYFVVS